MNESCFQDQKQFVTRRLIFPWQQNVFSIGLNTHLVTHAKTGALCPQNSFRVAAKNNSAACLGKRDVEVRRCSAVNWSQLLAHKRRRIYLSLTRRIFLSGWKFHSKSHRGLAIAVGFHLAKETIL